MSSVRTAVARARWNRIGVLVALLVLVLNAVIAWYPFRLRESIVANDARRTRNGDLHFGLHNSAVTPTAPAWTSEVADSGRLRVLLRLRPGRGSQDGIARIFTLAADIDHANLTIAQEQHDLVVRIRRPGSDVEGDPPLVVPDALLPRRWTTVELEVDGEVAAVAVDGTVRRSTSLTPGALAGWDLSYRLALGSDVTSLLPWVGDLRTVVVTTTAGSVDYLRPGAVMLGPTVPLPPEPQWQAVAWSSGAVRRYLPAAVAHALAFLPLGIALAAMRKPPLGLATVTAVGLVTSVVVTLGKLPVEGRHPSVIDIAAQTAGVVAGRSVGLRWPRPRRQGPKA